MPFARLHEPAAIRRALVLLLLVCCAGALPGCGDEPATPTAPDLTAPGDEPGTTPESRSGQPPQDATHGSGEAKEAGEGEVAPNAVEIRCDGKVVGRIGPAELTQPKPLIQFLPDEARDPAQWRSVILKSREGGMVRLNDAAKDLSAKVIRLYRGRGGDPAAGVFDRDAPAEGRRMPRPLQFVMHTDLILVWTQASAAEEPPKVDQLKVLIAGEDEQTVFTRKQLGQLTLRDAPPHPAVADGGKKRRGDNHKGWHLLDVAALVLEKDDVASIRVLGDNAPVTVAGRVLRHPGAQPIVRFNRRGFIAFDLGGTGPDGEALKGRARGVTTLEITRKP